MWLPERGKETGRFFRNACQGSSQGITVTRVAILGTGRVGQAIARGLAGSHEIRFGSRNPLGAKVPNGGRTVPQKEAASWADVVVLAVPYSAIQETVQAIGPATFRGKVIVDATNVVSPTMDLAVGFTTSGAEELAKLVPDARVVKTFNHVFAANMSTGQVGGERLTLFVAGNDSGAKETVMRLGSDIGFDPVDAGPLANARYLEPLGMQLIKLGLGLKMGTNIGYRLVRGPPAGPSRP